MWPIYFLIAEYAVIYLVVAVGVYVCFSVVAGHNRLGKRLFLAVLAFGACALAGYALENVTHSAAAHSNKTSPTNPIDS